MISTALIGTLGNLMPVWANKITETVDRKVTFTETLGARKAFMGRVSRREWQVTADLTFASELTGLEWLAAFGRESLVWFPPEAVSGNAFDPESAGLVSWRHSGVEGSFLEVEPGLWVKSATPTGTAVSLPYRRDVLDPLPVVPGKPLTVSAWMRGTTRIAVNWRNQVGSSVRIDTSPLENGQSLVRKSFTAIPPATAVQATFQFFGSQVAGPSLSFTDQVMPYTTGTGPLRVVVHGLERELVRIRHDGPMKNMSFTVSEVG